MGRRAQVRDGKGERRLEDVEECMELEEEKWNEE